MQRRNRRALARMRALAREPNRSFGLAMADVWPGRSILHLPLHCTPKWTHVIAPASLLEEWTMGAGASTALPRQHLRHVPSRSRWQQYLGCQSQAGVKASGFAGLDALGCGSYARLGAVKASRRGCRSANAIAAPCGRGGTGRRAGLKIQFW